MTTEKDYGEPLRYDPSWCGFATQRRPRDLLMAIIFILVLVGFFAVGGWAIKKGNPTQLERLNTIVHTENWLNKAMYRISQDKWKIIGISSASIGLALVWLCLLRAFTRPIVYISLFLGVAAVFALGGLCIGFAVKHHDFWLKLAGIIVLVCGGILVVVLFLLRKRIEFTCIMIEEACAGVMNNLSAIFIISPIIFAAFIGFIIFWTIAAVNLFSIPYPECVTKTGEELLQLALSNPNCQTVTKDGPKWLLLFFVWVLYWVCFFLAGVLQATFAGAIAQWYFGRNGVAVDGIPSFVSFRYAMTNSFGSIAFGSLMLSLLALVQWILAQAQREAPNKLVKCLLGCLQCICACIAGFLQWITRYAYIHIAMYGMSFLEAAKSSVQLLGRSGLERLLSDLLTNYVILLGNVLCSAALVGIVCAVSDKTGIDAFTVGLSVVVAMVVFHFFAVAVRVGADTVFVCYCEDMERNGEMRNYAAKPELHEAIQERARQVN